jgi:hypothetical protein
MQFDVHRNLGRGSVQAPYLLDIQHDNVDQFGIRIVAPLLRRGEVAASETLMPIIVVDGNAFLLSIPELFAINRHRLGAVVGNAKDHRDAIIRALDLLFTGF